MHFVLQVGRHSSAEHYGICRTNRFVQALQNGNLLPGLEQVKQLFESINEKCIATTLVKIVDYRNILIEIVNALLWNETLPATFGQSHEICDHSKS